MEFLYFLIGGLVAAASFDAVFPLWKHRPYTWRTFFLQVLFCALIAPTWPAVILYGVCRRAWKARCGLLRHDWRADGDHPSLPMRFWRCKRCRVEACTLQGKAPGVRGAEILSAASCRSDAATPGRRHVARSRGRARRDGRTRPSVGNQNDCATAAEIPGRGVSCGRWPGQTDPGSKVRARGRHRSISAVAFGKGPLRPLRRPGRSAGPDRPLGIKANRVAPPQ